MLQIFLKNADPIRLNAEFACAKGELLALVGPSGSGKTSVLRAIAGLLKSAQLLGRVSVGRRSQDVWFDSVHGLWQTPQQRRVGLVFQHYALFPYLAAIENVALAVFFDCARAYFDALFDRTGLAGLQQREALARVLAREPQELLLDEPFSAVDAPTRQTLHRKLAALRQSVAFPMVLVTHDLEETRRLADRVVILDGGESLQSDSPARGFVSPRNARVAELVGIQNHFRGRFFQHGPDDAPGCGRLVWHGEALGGARIGLRVIDKKRLEQSAEVSSAVAGELLDLSLHADPEALNTLACTLCEVLPLGEISLCMLVPSQLPSQRLTLNLSSVILRHLGAGPGAVLPLHSPPEAVHIMPVRQNQV